MGTVQEYLDRHNLAGCIEDAVNAAVRARSEAPVLFIAKHLSSQSLPEVLEVRSRQVLSSGGDPTVEAEVRTHRGTFQAVVASSGAVSKEHEAVHLRDGDNSTYLGRGVLKAVSNVSGKIAAMILGKDPKEQGVVDHIMSSEMDGSDNKAKLGANAILAVSMAVCRAGAAEKELPLYRHIADISGISQLVLPVPAFSFVSGGKDAPNQLPIKSISVLPSGARSFAEALQWGVEIFQMLKGLIGEKFGAAAALVDEDGCFAPPCDTEEALQLMLTVVEALGFAGRVEIAIDAGAGDFFSKDSHSYDLGFKTSESRLMSSRELLEWYLRLCSEYRVASITDPFDESDVAHWKQITASGACQIVGGDLLVSNPKRVQEAMADDACNALLLKVTQIGSITEAVDVANVARAAEWRVVVSDLTGETTDAFLADFAVGVSARVFKSGPPNRGERLAKYNQFLRIEEELGEACVYAGESWRPRVSH